MKRRYDEIPGRVRIFNAPWRGAGATSGRSSLASPSYYHCTQSNCEFAGVAPNGGSRPGWRRSECRSRSGSSPSDSTRTPTDPERTTAVRRRLVKSGVETGLRLLFCEFATRNRHFPPRVQPTCFRPQACPQAPRCNLMASDAQANPNKMTRKIAFICRSFVCPNRPFSKGYGRNKQTNRAPLQRASPVERRRSAG